MRASVASNRLSNEHSSCVPGTIWTAVRKMFMRNNDKDRFGEETRFHVSVPSSWGRQMARLAARAHRLTHSRVSRLPPAVLSRIIQVLTLRGRILPHEGTAQLSSAATPHRRQASCKLLKLAKAMGRSPVLRCKGCRQQTAQ